MENLCKKISIILTTKVSRDNRKQYCKDHANERAKIIEESLFNNCKKAKKDEWLNLYNNVDLNILINAVEDKTPQCMYI
jgi:hypothetical protein